jgi:hypothetical protein
MDSELLAAGISPGDASLYTSPDPEPAGDHDHHHHDDHHVGHPGREAADRR